MCIHAGEPEAADTDVRPTSESDATILARLANVHCHPTDVGTYSGPSFVDDVKLGTIVSQPSSPETFATSRSLAEPRFVRSV